MTYPFNRKNIRTTKQWSTKGFQLLADTSHNILTWTTHV